MASVLKLFQNVSAKFYRPNAYYCKRCLSSKPEVKEPAKKEAVQETPAEEAFHDDPLRGPNIHYPTPFDKRILVFAGRYKKIEDVPKTVSAAAFDKARNKARIKLSTYMMLATAVGCIGVAISGRRAAERGESVQQMNLDWHQEMNKK